MQFHLNGFEPGDPDMTHAHDVALAPDVSSALPAEVDVLIVGCGPAGLTLAAQLSAFPDIKTCIVEQKAGPLQLGQADGVACRTVEMFQAFGFAERVLRESYWVNETSFWRPDEARPEHVVRGGRVEDTEAGLSEFPHIILNQARIHDFYLDVMRKSPARLEPHYDRRFLDLSVDEKHAGEPGAYPVTVKLERLDASGGATAETVRARYVVGCDGARSGVRRSLGLALHGDSANHAWGVMDVLAVTDFPDIRMKSFIQSARDGSILIIPREGGYLVRLYIELDKLAAGERVANRQITVDRLIAAAQQIFKPHSLEVKEVAWWSVYEIGQRLCERFDDITPELAGARPPRVFIAGDACHTHSPKAGQGMNVSMQDGFNLGWKLAAVLRQQARPSLLETYSRERQAIARELIEFDREWSSMLTISAKAKAAGEKAPDPAETQRYFVRHGRYTAGTATQYAPALLTCSSAHQQLAAGFVTGARFHSAPVIRLADARPMQLGHVVQADGRWRLFALAGEADPTAAGSDIAALCGFLAATPSSPVLKYTPSDHDIDSVIDVRAVFQQPHRELDVNALPAFLLPRKGRYGLRDYEKMFCADPSQDIFDLRGIDRRRGCLVLVRPDQYVAQVLPLDGFAALAAFFDSFMLPATASIASRRDNRLQASA